MAIRSLTAALFCLPLTTAALAVPINYGDFAGVTVNFLQVTEDVASVGDSTPLFGPPNVSGDSIDFDPVSFAAGASGAGGVDITSGTVEFDIEALGSNVIDTLTLSEAGSTTLAGFGGRGTFTSATADVVIDIEEVDGAPTPGGTLNFITAMTFNPSDGDFDLSADGGGGPAFNSAWTGVADIDLHQVLSDAGINYTNGPTLITVSIANTLTALSEDGTQAVIAKQDADGVVVTVNIPEPAAVGLLLLAMAPLTAARMR